jgi:uncharacterized membrane protein
VLALGLAQGARAHEEGPHKGKEKCFGIVKAGENNCANLSGSHACAGAASTDNAPDEWKLVPTGTCAKLGGMTIEQAKAALAKAKADH